MFGNLDFKIKACLDKVECLELRVDSEALYLVKWCMVLSFSKDLDWSDGRRVMLILDFPCLCYTNVYEE